MIVHAVVVNWNGGDASLRSVGSLSAGTVAPATIHVVDNGSTDGSAERIEAAVPGVRLQRQGRNLGFSAGANAGIRAALAEGAEAVFLLNNDATAEADALAALVRAAEHRPDCGLLGGRIWRDRRAGVLWCCGVSLGWWPNLCRLRGFGRKGEGRYLREEVVDALTGCALLVRREVFERVGLLDEGFFVYVEDADLCARAAAAGFRCLYVPDAVFEHAGAGSTGGGYGPARKYLTAHGSVLYLRRHGTPLLWAGFLVVDVFAWPLLLIAESLRGRAASALAKGRGLLHGLLGRPPDRRIVGAGRGPGP